eukprot:1194666-Prorocentrum_minimum.AAC.11
MCWYQEIPKGSIGGFRRSRDSVEFSRKRRRSTSHLHVLPRDRQAFGFCWRLIQGPANIKEHQFRTIHPGLRPTIFHLAVTVSRPVGICTRSRRRYGMGC